MNIPDPSAALSVEEGALEENTLYSNTLISSNGQRINFDQQKQD
jgi:hypothetical protein